jgi:hypothetical protein
VDSVLTILPPSVDPRAITRMFDVQVAVLDCGLGEGIALTRTAKASGRTKSFILADLGSLPSIRC